MDFYKQHVNELLTLQSSDVNEDIGTDQPDPEMYFNHVMANRALDGLVHLVFPPCLFTYADGNSGLVQNFIVLDSSAKKAWLFNMELQNYCLEQASRKFISETKQNIVFRIAN